MRTKILGTVAAAALVLTACGGDDDSGGGSSQDEVADMIIDAMREEAGDLADVVDEDCVRDATGQLSDDDAKAILDAGPDGDPEVSDAAVGASLAMMDCIDIGAMIDEGLENLDDG